MDSLERNKNLPGNSPVDGRALDRVRRALEQLTHATYESGPDAAARVGESASCANCFTNSHVGL